MMADEEVKFDSYGLPIDEYYDLDYMGLTAGERECPPFDYEKALNNAAFLAAKYIEDYNPRTERTTRLKKEYENAENKKETEIYKNEKERLDKILAHSEVERLIPKSQWTDFTELVGHAIKVDAHPHVLFAQERMLQIAEKYKRADILVTSPCTASKPYSAVGRNQKFIKASRETGLFDYLISSTIPITLTPFDASVCYPFANYSTPDDPKLSSYIGNRLVTLLQCKNMAETIRRLGYKKVIFIHAGQLTPRVDYLKKVWHFDEKSLIEPYHYAMYYRASRFIFSTRELPEPKTFYSGAGITRFVGGSVVSCFMRDVFGPAVYPYFKMGWEDMDEKTKEYARYSEEERWAIVDDVGIEKPTGALDKFW